MLRLAPVRAGQIFQMRDLRARAIEERAILEDDEIHVAIARGEVLRGGRAAGIHDRRMRLLQRFGLAPDRDRVEALAVEVEFPVLRPRAAHEIEPFGGIFVAVVVRAHVGAEHVELVLEPAAHDVEREAPVGDVIDGRRHLRDHQRMNQRHVDGGEHRAIVRHRADRRRPGEALERAIVEVRRAAVTLPAPDRQKRLHAGAIDRLGDVASVGPVELPGFRDGGDGRAMAAIERHDAELHAVAAEQPRAGRVVGCGRVHAPFLEFVPRGLVITGPEHGMIRIA